MCGNNNYFNIIKLIDLEGNLVIYIYVCTGRSQLIEYFLSYVARQFKKYGLEKNAFKDLSLEKCFLIFTAILGPYKKYTLYIYIYIKYLPDIIRHVVKDLLCKKLNGSRARLYNIPA